MYKPPYNITEQMLKLISDISEKVGKIQGYHTLSTHPNLRKSNRIRSIHSSLAIEANSLSLVEVRDVIDGRTVIGNRDEIKEVQNAYRAYEAIQEINPFNMEDLKRMHGVMTDGLVSECGKFRSGEEGVFDGDRCIFMAPPAKFVTGQMNDLFEWMNREKENVHPLIMSSVFHYEFVFIHPFADGNGRMARLWQTALLYGWRELFQYVPLESQIKNFQSEYYEVIARCHKNGGSDEFIMFMLKRLDAVLGEVLSKPSVLYENTTPQVERLMETMEFDIPYTDVQLMGALGLKSRKSFRENYLQSAIEDKIIEMTIPDKATSRNQRYVMKKK